jgi:hypothetical protein
MSYMIVNDTGGIMRVGWYDIDGNYQEETQWETLEDAKVAYLLLTEYAIGGEINAIRRLKIIQTLDV